MLARVIPEVSLQVGNVVKFKQPESVKKARKDKREGRAKENEIYLNVLSNEPTKRCYDLLEMFYHGAVEGSIAYMDALDTSTGKVVPLLVGLSLNQETNKIDSFPLARILDREEVINFIAPDGKGNYGNGQAD